MKKRSVFKLIAICILVVCVAAVGIASFFVFKPFEPTTSDGKEVTAAAEVTKEKLTAYANDYTRNSAMFSESVFKVALNASAACSDKKADLKQIATDLKLSAIAVTDDKGKIISAYPEELKDKKLTDNANTKELNPVAKKMSPKKLGGIVDNGDGKYTVYAAAERQGEDMGAVVISLVSEDYAKVCGATLAAECGNRVIVEKTGKRLSSTFKEVGGDSIGDYDKNSNGKPFVITIDKCNFDAKTVEVSNYKALTAVVGLNNGANPVAFWIIAGADLVLLVVGVMIILRAGKSKKDEE